MDTIDCGRNGATIVFIVLSSITLFLATVFVALRLYLRLYITHQFWWDDVCIILAYGLMIPVCGLLWRMTDRGLGRGISCVPHYYVVDDVELKNAAELLQILGTMFSRTSVAFFVGRLFATTRWMRVSLYSYTVFMCLSMILSAVLTYTVCQPEYVYFNIRPGSLMNCKGTLGINFRDYYNGSVGVLSDLLLALVPAAFLSGLNLSRRQRIELSSLMGFGLIPAGCCLARTILLSQMNYREDLRSLAKIMLFGTLEASTLVIGASIPTLRPFFLPKERQLKLFGAPGWNFQLVGRSKRGAPEEEPKLSPRKKSFGIPRPSIAGLRPHQVQVTRSWDVASVNRHSGTTLAGDEERPNSHVRISAGEGAWVGH